jgi:hypothetical protein
MKLKYSFPNLNEELFNKAEKILEERFGYSNIPDEYKQFLLKNNGGYVSPGFIDDTENTEHDKEVVFDTPLKWAKDNDRPVTPSIIMYFGIWLKDDMEESEIENWDLNELILSNEHSKNDFNVLPDNMMSIAKCSHPEADDMLCLSVDKTDFGAVYFYYGMHYYPANFMGTYYADKTKKIFEHHNIQSENDIDEHTSLGKEILIQLARVPFVKVADSFTEFLNSCRIQASKI